MTPESGQTSWDYCPTEILYMILKEIDIRTFFSCRCVCKRWKEVADDIGQDHKIWERFCKEDYSEFYLDFHRKSQLPWIKVYKNIQLWKKIENSALSINSSISYNNLQIINVHVFKDNLIVVCNTCIKYYNLYELHLIKTVGRICLDCQENEYMNLELKPNCTLCLYGKSKANDFFVNPLPSNENHNNVVCYRLQGEQCYFIDQKRALWICEWKNNTWRKIFLARYYGFIPILDMIIQKDEIYILLHGGNIYKVTQNERRFYKLCSTRLPPFISKAFLLTTYDSIISVTSTYAMVHKLENNSAVKIPGVTCFVEHAGMLILGKDYGIEIYNKDEMMTPLHIFYIGDVGSTPKKIIGIDVYEYHQHCHFIIACTESDVCVVLCYHPYDKISDKLYKMFCIK